MEANFWHQRWQNNELGFQLEQAHPLLCQLLPKFLKQHTKVFVPLCGKSPDISYLARYLSVVGAELSTIACQDFFNEQQLNVTCSAYGSFNRYHAANIEIWQGDYFQLHPEHVEGCRFVYDRAAIIALPPEMRQRYVAKLRQLLPAKTELLLISVEYPEHEKAGPPFNLDYAQINRLFHTEEVSLLAELDQTGKGFARRRFATGYLYERAYLIRM